MVFNLDSIFKFPRGRSLVVASHHKEIRIDLGVDTLRAVNVRNHHILDLIAANKNIYIKKKLKF